MDWNSIKDVDLTGKRVLLRLDLNLPVVNGVISDMTRLARSRPTINHILSAGGKVVILAHFGRPNGIASADHSFAPFVEQISQFLGRKIAFFQHNGTRPLPCLSKDQQNADILLVENSRFFAGEETGDLDLAQALSKLGDVFCNDAFSVVHRAHATVTGLAAYLPSFAGLALESELSTLTDTLHAPEKPIVAIVGGAKVSTKMKVLRNMVKQVDCLIIGGGMANTFLAAKGYGLGQSLMEEDFVEMAAQVIRLAQQNDCRIYLPVDANTHTAFEATKTARCYPVDNIPENAMILDYGPQSIAQVVQIICTAKTVLWNGPLGAFEIAPFDQGSVAVAREIAEKTALGQMRSVAGGGDTVSVLNQAGCAENLTFVSTAGGAFLEWLEGRTLPGLEVLRRDIADTNRA